YEAGRHNNKTCRYNQNQGYVVFSAMGSFFVPLVVMLYVYAKIHCVVARRHDHLSAWDSRQQAVSPARRLTLASLLQTTRKLRDVNLDVRSPVPCSYSSGSGGPGAGAGAATQLDADGDGSSSRSGTRRCQKCCRASCSASQVSGQVSSLNGNLASQSNSVQIPFKQIKVFNRVVVHLKVFNSEVVHLTMTGSGSLGALSTSCLPATPPSNEPADLNHHHNHHHHHHHHKRPHHTYAGVSAGGPRVSSFRRAESKTAKTLWMLVGGFVACWLPFFVVYIMTPFLPHEAVSKGLQLGLTWLGWINSAVNPFIYAFYSPDFRVAFWRLTLRHCTPRSKAPGPPDSVRK
ncbi:Octopamine receptor 1, partial [Frankliniella fusca]